MTSHVAVTQVFKMIMLVSLPKTASVDGGSCGGEDGVSVAQGVEKESSSPICVFSGVSEKKQLKS